jgi:integrase/recombinase XerD
MGMEQVFSCLRTLRRLRSGPLGMLLDDFCVWLLKHGFSRTTIRKHLSHVSHFNRYLGRRRVAAGHHLCAKDVDGFFAAYPSWCRRRGSLEAHLLRVRHSLSRFIYYLDEQGRFETSPHAEIHQALLHAYLAWMADYQHVSSGTLDLRAQYLTIFLKWLGPQATPQGLQTLGPDDVETFFLEYAQKSGKSARRSMQASLRTFFRFCLYQGYTEASLDLAVPTLRTYKLASVPCGLTDTQAQLVLQGIDRAGKVGRRDYAILQLLYTYGVRGGQVRALRLEQVDWIRNQILFEPAKRGKASLLPLTPEVGEALLDYLRNSRPASRYPQLFLTTRAPYHPLPRSSSLAAIVSRRIQAVGMDIPHQGAHLFRHGFATRMLQQGQPLKAVADVLGHLHLDTTFLYTKVDFTSLRQVALDWPEEVLR